MFDVFHLFEAFGAKKQAMVDRVDLTIQKM